MNGPTLHDLPETIEGDPASRWEWGHLDPRAVSSEGPAPIRSAIANSNSASRARNGGRLSSLLPSAHGPAGVATSLIYSSEHGLRTPVSHSRKANPHKE